MSWYFIIGVAFGVYKCVNNILVILTAQGMTNYVFVDEKLAEDAAMIFDMSKWYGWAIVILGVMFHTFVWPVAAIGTIISLYWQEKLWKKNNSF